ncbi:hypothetical protein LTR86_004987 [Recurvomyces mirabilis]|nr:hypothetical protein LTR86_004987 [Recurvomyces mirabilis]
MPETKYFHHNLTLSPHSEPAKTTFPAKLAYWTFGDASNPAVLFPSCYGGTLANTLPFLYDEKAHPNPILPPSKYFIIVTGLLSGSESSSPSNQEKPHNGPNFPHVTYEDNIRLQHALCTEELEVKKLYLYCGFSMGGQQAYHMSALFPEFVENMVCLAGSARTSWHNWCFLEGPRHALITAKDYEGGQYTKPANDGVKAFFRVYAPWALSQGWFREKCWKQAGFKTLEDYLTANWSGGEGVDANDLLWLLWTWQKGDITLYYPEDKGDLAKTLGMIKARCLIFPSRTDTYFPPEDSEEEVKHLRDGRLAIIETVWGHMAGGGSGTGEDTECIIREVKKFLEFLLVVHRLVEDQIVSERRLFHVLCFTAHMAWLRILSIVVALVVVPFTQLQYTTLIHLIMHVTRPHRRTAPTGHLRRVLLDDLPEVLGAFPARVEAHEEVDVGFQGGLFVDAGGVREAGHDCVEEFPGGAAEFGFGGFVAEFGHYDVAGEGGFVDGNIVGGVGWGEGVVGGRGGGAVGGPTVGREEDEEDDGGDGEEGEEVAAGGDLWHSGLLSG